jgi:hypothetical protein
LDSCGFSDAVLECISGVPWEGSEAIIIQEGLDFVVIISLVKYDEEIALVGSCDYCMVVA